MHRLGRRSVLLGALLLPVAARAQTWPPGVLKIVVPFAPGGSVDAIARLAQAGLQSRLGTTVVVENRAGASGSIGAASVAKSPPDGSTWLFVFDTHAVNPALIDAMPFDTDRDLDPVLLIGTAPNVLACHPPKPYKTFADVLAAAKQKPDSISYATVGAGSLGHCTMVLMEKRTGIRLVHVPYRGGGPALQDALAGQVDLIIGSTALVNSQIQAGALRPLVQTGKTRATALPDLPTAAESGLENFESLAWWGVFVRAGTPAPVVDRFRAELTAALKDERVAKQMAETQQITPALAGPDEFRRFFDEQRRVWGAVVRENGIKSES